MNRHIDAFEAGFNWLLLFLAALVAISIGLIAVLIPINLLLIKMTWGNIWWLYEGVEYALYAGVFLGAPWVLQQGAHVRVDILSAALPKSMAAQLERILDFAAAGLCLVLCYYGIRATISEYVDGTMPDKVLSIANWIILVVFAFSFFLLAIEFLLRVRRAREIVAKAETSATKSGF